MLAPPRKKKPVSVGAETGSREVSGRSVVKQTNDNQTLGKRQDRESPQAAWRRRNPKAAWAHSCLQSALRRGLIEKQPCEVCGAPEVDGHHDRYHEPMAVRWLCRGHHKALHKAERERRKGGANG